MTAIDNIVERTPGVIPEDLVRSVAMCSMDIIERTSSKLRLMIYENTYMLDAGYNRYIIDLVTVVCGTLMETSAGRRLHATDIEDAVETILTQHVGHLYTRNLTGKLNIPQDVVRDMQDGAREWQANNSYVKQFLDRLTRDTADRNRSGSARGQRSGFDRGNQGGGEQRRGGNYAEASRSAQSMLRNDRPNRSSGPTYSGGDMEMSDAMLVQIEAAEKAERKPTRMTQPVARPMPEPTPEPELTDNLNKFVPSKDVPFLTCYAPSRNQLRLIRLPDDSILPTVTPIMEEYMEVSKHRLPMNQSMVRTAAVQTANKSLVERALQLRAAEVAERPTPEAPVRHLPELKTLFSFDRKSYDGSQSLINHLTELSGNTDSEVVAVAGSFTKHVTAGSNIMETIAGYDGGLLGLAAYMADYVDDKDHAAFIKVLNEHLTRYIRICIGHHLSLDLNMTDGFMNDYHAIERHLADSYGDWMRERFVKLMDWLYGDLVCGITQTKSLVTIQEGMYGIYIDRFLHELDVSCGKLGMVIDSNSAGAYLTRIIATVDSDYDGFESNVNTTYVITKDQAMLMITKQRYSATETDAERYLITRIM